MRVYALCPSHHARTSPDVFSESRRQSANEGFDRIAFSSFLSGYCKHNCHDVSLIAYTEIR
jgi:hypothetical protein